ncbi:hypothetical protein ACIBBG_16400 [Micromonospora chersina]|uniref:hypothetical protein n=1 Tax=Micromonospora chersina TaxID=47854 RepID=UPI0037A7A84A
MTDLAAPPEGDPPARCGATNPTFGLRCDREPHPPGTTHYQDDGVGVRAWYHPQPDRITAWDIPSWEKVRDRVLARVVPADHHQEPTGHTTTVAIVRDDQGEHCIVHQADPILWIAETLVAEIKAQNPEDRIPGSAVLNWPWLTLGTPGEGLGQLTYLNTGATIEQHGTTYQVYARAR